MKPSVKHILSALFICSITLLAAQEDGGKQLRNKRNNPYVKTRIGFSPVIGFYKPNKNHTGGAKQKMAFNVSLKEEIRLNKKNTSFLMVGVEYFLHGLTFNSYYFYSDSLKLYNGNMTAKYSLVLQELNVPIQLKYSLQKETNTITSSYLFAGYVARFLLANNLTVTNNGTEVFNKQENIKFKNPVFSANSNSFLCFGIGTQRNTQLRQNAVYAELQYRHSLAPMFFEEPFAPSNLFINQHFFMLTVGFKI